MIPERAGGRHRGLPSTCPLPGGCTALADGARTGEYGRCWCRGDDQVRVRWFDLLSPLVAAALALVATLLTGFFVLDYTSHTVAGDSYHFWGWPRAWRTDMPQEAMRQSETVIFHGRVDGHIDWQEPGFERGELAWDWATFFVMILGCYVVLRVLWILLRVASRRIIIARRLSTHKQA